MNVGVEDAGAEAHGWGLQRILLWDVYGELEVAALERSIFRSL